MKTKIKSFSTIAVSLAVLLFALIFASGNTASRTAENPEFNDFTISTISSDSSKIVIVSADKTDMKIFFSSDSVAADQTLAKDLSTLISELYGIRIRALPDTSERPTANEILIGDTNRPETSELQEAVTSKANSTGDFYWAYAVVNGKLVFCASEALSYQFASESFLKYLADNNFTLPSDLSVLGSKSRAEYEEELRKEEEEARKLRVEELKKTNSNFTQEDFGGDFLTMPENAYKSPAYYPIKGQHPRLFFTEKDIPAIYDALLNDPELTYLRGQIWAYADAENFTGIFPETTGKSGNVYRYDTTVLAQLEAKAMAYLLTGDELYGYEAIIGAKNAMLYLLYTADVASDTYHGASHVMVNVAKVFDWCYDLMSEDDKNQIIAGVSNVLAPQLENGMKFPPSGMNGVSGHGTGPQFIRDWVTVSLAFYDEAPSWWQFVGGRFFEEYVPVIDYCYQGGFASQGTVTYGNSKYFTKAWAAYLIQNSTGYSPYVENFHLGAYYYFSHIHSNDRFFQTGDGGRSSTGTAVSNNTLGWMFLSALMYDDPTIGAMAKYYSKDYTEFAYHCTLECTVPDVLIWKTLGPEINEAPKENIDTIQYLPFPSGTMTARESWSTDAAVVLMRIGELTMANHDLRDHGTFQIYYKGLLAGSSGSYKLYGGNVHKYYLQATVAHNGLLVFDPSLADKNPMWNCAENHTHSATTCKIANAERYYYSGSQYARGEAGNIQKWLSGKYHMAEVYGSDWSYNSDGSSKWAYIAGDLTNAYEAKTVAYAGRKMLTIFTGDEAYPMLFFTYDQLSSATGGEDFTKTFLLHTVKEPVVDEENLTAVVTEGEGRLFLHSISGAQKIEKIGGEGKAYWINGKNCLDPADNNDNADKIWGRLELSVKGNLSDSLLTAMYVADATNDTPLDVEKISNASVDGVMIKDNIVVFTKTNSEGQEYREFTFSTSGKGLKSYYIAGLESGTWNISVDGISVAYVNTDKESGIVSFVAPCGNVKVSPTDNVIGANGGKITYVTNGGTLPDGTAHSYTSEKQTDLPTSATRGTDKFLGWYTSESFEESTRVTKTPLGFTGTFTVYAKWLSTLVDIDFTSSAVIVNTVEKSATNIATFSAKDKPGASFITKTEDGQQYLEWIEGTKDPTITYQNKEINYASMSADDECATFTVTLSKNGDAPMMTSHFRIYTKKTVSGGSATTRQYIFTTNAAGEVRLGVTEEVTTGPLVATLTDKPITLRFVMDFKNEEIRAYDEAGTLLASSKVAVKSASGAANMSEWRKLLDSIVFYWYGASSADAPTSSMRIYGIKIEEGDRVTNSK